MSNESKLIDMGDFIGFNFAENHFVCYLNKAPTARYVTLAGSTEAIAMLNIPFSHRLIKILMRQSTATSSADGGTEHSIQVRRDYGAISSCSTGKEILMTQNCLVDPVNVLIFGDGFEYEATNWTLAFTGVSTYKIHPVIYIQRLQR